MRCPISKFVGLLCFVATLLVAPSLQASVVTLGFVTFDIDNPVSGENSFSIYNNTGQTFGCYPGFDICDNVAVESATLAITYDDSLNMFHSLTIDLQNSALPGVTSPSEFVFDATRVIVLSAEITGKISPGSFLLDDSSTFVADPSFDTVIDLNAGYGLIEVNSADTSASAPEPASFALALLVIPLLFFISRRRSA